MTGVVGIGITVSFFSFLSETDGFVDSVDGFGAALEDFKVSVSFLGMREDFFELLELLLFFFDFDFDDFLLDFSDFPSLGKTS